MDVKRTLYRWSETDMRIVIDYMDSVEDMISIHERKYSIYGWIYWMTGLVIIILNILTSSFNVITKKAEADKCLEESNWVDTLDILSITLGVLQGIVLFVNPSAISQEHKFLMEEFQFLLLQLSNVTHRDVHPYTFDSFIRPIEERFQKLNGTLRVSESIRSIRRREKLLQFRFNSPNPVAVTPTRRSSEVVSTVNQEQGSPDKGPTSVNFYDYQPHFTREEKEVRDRKTDREVSPTRKFYIIT